MKEIKETFGIILVIIGIVGIAILITMGAYLAFGWIGTITMLFILSFLVGMTLLEGGR